MVLVTALQAKTVRNAVYNRVGEFSHPLFKEVLMADVEQIVDEKIEVATDEPKRYKVIFLNDNQTPMEWVVSVLREQYRYTLDQATEITMEIHNEGAAVVGTYSYEIAEQKAYETVSASRLQGFPLKLRVEEEG